MAEEPIRDPVEALATLAEPTRRRLYDWVVAQKEPVGRDEAAHTLGLGRPLVAHHLDRLVDAGLLTPEYRRLSGRTGPGAGRPAKLYRRAAADVEVSLPRRQYELAARMLAKGAEAASEPVPPAGVRDAATRHGRTLGVEARRRAGRRPTRPAIRRSLAAVLAENGYEPAEQPDGAIRLGNCPFDALVADHRDLVCGMNLAIADGLIDELDPDGLAARLDPKPGWCCVAIEAAARPAG
jgi:predicted ArsR family transcriptional regulator